MHDVELQQLNARLRAVELGAKLEDHKFEGALFEYGSFVAASPVLSKHVHDMAIERDVDPETLYELYMFGFLRNGFRNAVLKTDSIGSPLFWDKEVEAVQGLAARFIKMLRTEDKHLRASKRAGVNIMDVVLPEDTAAPKSTKEEAFFRFQVFHNRLTERVLNEAPSQISFDEQSGTLTVGSFEVKFRKFTEQYHCLRVLFEKASALSEERFYDEIADEIDRSKRFNPKSFHNYFSAIKQRVLRATGLDDVFLTTSQSVSINKKYLQSLK